MKKSVLLFLLLSPFLGYAQYTLIPDVNFEKALIFLNYDSGTPDGKVLTANINGVTDLSLDNKNISDMTGIEDFTNLTLLTVRDNNLLTTLDLSKNIKLEYLRCDENKLQTLNIKNNLDLKRLNCTKNKLTALDISNNTKLTELLCDLNKLQSLDINNNINLTYLWCGSNEITALDISNNIDLNYISCLSNKLTALNTSNNINLIHLFCSKNELTTIDISNNTKLTAFYCHDNKLQTLDVSNNTELALLFCQKNKLTALNLKNRIILGLDSSSNPNLSCILVDDPVPFNTSPNVTKDPTSQFSTTCDVILSPSIAAIGDQLYCNLTNINIVTYVKIIDPSNLGSTSVTVQISSGYKKGEDLLTLNNTLSHPTIESSWIEKEGKLTLKSKTGNAISYADFEDAIRDIQFSNSSATPTGIRNFSISIGVGQISYLPRNKHYYEYVSAPGISWTKAKNDAALKTYYGLQGYLVTLTAADEAQLAGAQAPGTGWIGGTDSEKEGEWKWVTGPEAGTVFWNGIGNGNTPNYANWNKPSEPNNFGNNENYAHITSPAVGNPGTWNDLPEQGGTGDYYPNGYIVEYGGMTNDPILVLSASTTITIAAISSTTAGSKCDAGSVILKATATAGEINWYDVMTGGKSLEKGPSFSTPNITSTTIFYVETSSTNCSSSRIPVEAKIINTPTITNTNTPVTRCGPGSFTLEATPSEGTINWYSQINGSITGTGNTFMTPSISNNTSYFAEAVNKGCINNLKSQIDLIVYPLPAISDQNQEKCISQTITLDAGITNLKYLWSTGAITQTIDVTDKGIYTVAVTSLAPENCTNKKTITVVENDLPKIKNVIVKEATVTIELEKNQSYFEFSIDGTNYQNSNVFNNVPSGLHTAHVREINFCSSDQNPFIVIIIPKFFTPNNDQYNDVWEVKGILNYPTAEITIFDRYGKLITVLNRNNHSWDGTFNKELLPSTDYWYVLKLDANGPELKGHFSLKR